MKSLSPKPIKPGGLTRSPQPELLFNAQNFKQLCRRVAATDPDLQLIIDEHGYPPLWSREPSFETLVHFILEQQVSLASAKAALLKLQERLGQVTPQNFLLLTNEQLRACYFSRQKTLYAQLLAKALLQEDLVLEKLRYLPDELIRTELKKLKGFGDWTVDVFLMMSLHRCDVFAIGDVALLKSLRELKNLPSTTTKQELLIIADQWRPYRTIAAYLLWHSYLQKRGRK